MTVRHVALFVHLLGALTMVAGIAVAGVTHRLARRSDDVGDVATLLRGARAGVLLAAPGALVLLGGGFWLVHLEHLDAGAGWLRDAIALFLLAGLLGAAGGRRPRQARELAERLREHETTVGPELRRLLGDRRSAAANLGACGAFLAILWLMVAKPS